MARNRRPPAGGRAGGRTGSRPGSQLGGLRWVPVPLAMLLAVLGFLVLGAAAGQHSVNDRSSGLEAGGLGLTVNTMLWMDDSMGVPGTPTSKGFQMPASEMPGLQTAGDKRLRIEVYLRNVSKDMQQYALSEFRLVGRGGGTWKVLANAVTQHSIAPQEGSIAPGWSTTLDLYYDVPTAQVKHLSVRWTHNGSTVTFPVHSSGIDSTSVMAGM